MSIVDGLNRGLRINRIFVRVGRLIACESLIAGWFVRLIVLEFQIIIIDRDRLQRVERNRADQYPQILARGRSKSHD